jgi:hypothetical protein
MALMFFSPDFIGRWWILDFFPGYASRPTFAEAG